MPGVSGKKSQKLILDWVSKDHWEPGFNTFEYYHFFHSYFSSFTKKYEYLILDAENNLDFLLAVLADVWNQGENFVDIYFFLAECCNKAWA